MSGGTVAPSPAIYGVTLAKWGHVHPQVGANGSFVSNNNIFTILFFNTYYYNWINKISIQAVFRSSIRPYVTLDSCVLANQCWNDFAETGHECSSCGMVRTQAIGSKYREISNINGTLVSNKIVDHTHVGADPTTYFHSWLNTWLPWIVQSQLQEETRNISVCDLRRLMLEVRDSILHWRKDVTGRECTHQGIIQNVYQLFWCISLDNILKHCCHRST